MKNKEMKNPILNELDDNALDNVSGGYTPEESMEKYGFCAWTGICKNCDKDSVWETIVPAPPSGKNCPWCNAELTRYTLAHSFYYRYDE